MNVSAGYSHISKDVRKYNCDAIDYYYYRAHKVKFIVFIFWLSQMLDPRQSHNYKPRLW